jgi:hypothetical protein
VAVQAAQEAPELAIRIYGSSSGTSSIAGLCI